LHLLPKGALRLTAGSRKRPGLVKPLLDDLDVPGGKVVEAFRDIADHGIGQGVCCAADGQHVQEPGHWKARGPVVAGHRLM